MNKKTYLVPQIKFIPVEANDIIATSTGATGEDVPWASVRPNRHNLYDDEFYDITE